MDMFSISQRNRLAPSARRRSLRPIRSLKRCGGLALFLVIMLGFGQVTSAEPDPGVVIDINNPERSLYPIAIPRGLGSSALVKQASEIARFNLSVSGWFRVLDSRSFLANLGAEGLSINPNAWENVGAFGVMKYRIEVAGNQVTLSTRLYEVEKGNRSVLTREYRGPTSQFRRLVHRWCNDVVRYYTGEAGFFGSKIAFVSRGKTGTKHIRAVDFDGNRPYTLVGNRSINILPAWSKSGGQLAFTSYARGNPDLYVLGRGGGRSRRISNREGMNTGASWSPGGGRIAVTLSRDGNAEIYVISARDGSIIRRLTNSRGIDTAPAWSPNGREIAFVSDREGGPNIFVMNANGSNQRRVSFNGNYNTDPDWSPRKGARTLVYTTRAGRRYDIVTLDLSTNAMVRITQNQGNNEDPSFSPNGRAIAFVSRRRGGSGIYIANADGTGKQQRIYRGSASSVDWGPAPR